MEPAAAPRLLVGLRDDCYGISESASIRNQTALLRCTRFALVEDDRQQPIVEWALDQNLIGIVRQVQGSRATAVVAFGTREGALLLLS